MDNQFNKKPIKPKLSIPTHRFWFGGGNTWVSNPNLIVFEKMEGNQSTLHTRGKNPITSICHDILFSVGRSLFWVGQSVVGQRTRQISTDCSASLAYAYVLIMPTYLPDKWQRSLAWVCCNPIRQTRIRYSPQFSRLVSLQEMRKSDENWPRSCLWMYLYFTSLHMLWKYLKMDLSIGIKYCKVVCKLDLLEKKENRDAD